MNIISTLTSDIRLATGFQLAKWVYQNSDKIPLRLHNLADYITDSSEGIRRIGGAVVFGSPEGKKVLAFVDEMTNSQAVLYQNSIISLGFTGISSVALGMGFLFLRNQFNTLNKKIDRLAKMIDDQTIAELKAGLDALESGKALHVFSDRLGDELINKHKDRKLLHHLAQNVCIALCAVVHCEIYLEDDSTAKKSLNSHANLIHKSTAEIFKQTIGTYPGRFLKPDLQLHDNSEGKGIEYLRGIIRKAIDNKIDVGSQELLKASDTLPDFVEYLLKQSKGGWFTSKASDTLIKEMNEADVCLEESSRLTSLEMLFNEAKKAKTKMKELFSKLNSEVKDKSSQNGFVLWNV